MSTTKQYLLPLSLIFSLGFYMAPVHASKNEKSLPNILFIVMDDAGVDQMKIFGYGGLNPPSLPNIDALALGGIRFRNAWTMPDCSPSRATFWSGQYPFRTNIENPIQPPDLANSQVSPYEVTLPEILRLKGYTSGLIAKMHLSGSSLNSANNPLGNEVYKKLGFDYFEGFLEGAPLAIDTTAGGVAPTGTYACGFVPNTTDNPSSGVNEGACYQPNGACEVLSTATTPTPGRLCLENGGILDPSQPATCKSSLPSNLLFTTQNGYYTGNWVINKKGEPTKTQPPQDPAGRGYRSILEANRAIAWINEQKSIRSTEGKPWMATVGFSASHTPYHNVPASLLPSDAINSSGFNCVGSDLDHHELMKQQMEGMDHEIGRLLVETGLANQTRTGEIQYNPKATDTMIVLIGDNGTWAPGVRAPFNPDRAKGTLYQTGVWAPLTISGPMVEAPGRVVEHMVNGIDLFALFGEMAGINVRKEVPKYTTLDAVSMLPYLTNPNQPSIRKTNFTQTGDNFRSAGAPPSPCAIPALNVCTSFFPTQSICQKNQGVWYGANGVAGVNGLSDCCAVNDYQSANNLPLFTLSPIKASAIRNSDYKLVQLENSSCATPSAGNVITNELYKINQNFPIPKLDNPGDNLLTNGVNNLKPKEKIEYFKLLKETTKLQKSTVECLGDGNLDLVVNYKDIEGWRTFSKVNNGQSSWFDFNLDGLTNEEDLVIIEENLGKNCRKTK